MQRQQTSAETGHKSLNIVVVICGVERKILLYIVSIPHW